MCRLRKSATNQYQSISIYPSIVIENWYQSITTWIVVIDWSSIININRLIGTEVNSHLQSHVMSVQCRWYWTLVIDLNWSPIHFRSITRDMRVIQLTLRLKMTTAQIVEMSITVNNNSHIQGYVHPDNCTQPTCEMTPGFKPFTECIVECNLVTHVCFVGI